MPGAVNRSLLRLGMSGLLLALFLAGGTGGTEPSDRVTWSVRPCRGVATLHRNGKPVLVNMVYDQDSGLARYTPVLAPVWSDPREADIHLHQLPAYLGWKEPGDQRAWYANLAERLAALIKADPQAAVLIRVLLWPSADWAKKYPEELVRDENGTTAQDVWPPVSMMSRRYFQDAAKGLRALATLVEAGAYKNRVIGYLPCFGLTETISFRTSASLLADYSPVAQREFSRYLMAKYGSMSGVNQALGTTFTTEAEIRIPSERQFLGDANAFFLDPARSQYLVAYYQFNDAMIADGAIELCRAAKEVSPDKIAGTWYAQVVQATWGSRPIVQHGRYAWKRLAQSGYVDFLCTPAFYAHSGLAHPVRMQGILDSINLYGKTFLFEYDRPTHLLRYLPTLMNGYYAESDGLLPLAPGGSGEGPVVGTLDDYRRTHGELLASLEKAGKNKHEIDLGHNYRDEFLRWEEQGERACRFRPTNDRTPGNMSETIANVRRWASFCAARPTAGLWWWDQEGAIRKATGGVAFNHPRLTHELQRVNRLFEKAVEVDRTSRAEMAVFYDITSCYYQAPRGGGSYLTAALVENSIPLGNSGVPCDEYFFSELEDIPNLAKYKVLVFLNANYIPERTRVWIDRHVKKDGRVLVWFFGSGYLDESGLGATKMEQATGIRFQEETGKEFVACELSNFDDDVTRGVPGEQARFGCFRAERHMLQPWFSVNDPKATILGVSLSRRKPVCAVKNLDAWRSVYIPTGPLPVRLIKNLAAMAGSQVYTESEDMNVWASRSLVVVYSHPSVKGKRRIHFPKDVRRCEEFWSGKTWQLDQGSLEWEFNGATTLCFFVQ